MPRTVFSPEPTRERTCDDCGRFRTVARVTFWLNGYRTWLCGECRRPYRDRLNRYDERSTDA